MENANEFDNKMLRDNILRYVLYFYFPYFCIAIASKEHCILLVHNTSTQYISNT